MKEVKSFDQSRNTFLHVLGETINKDTHLIETRHYINLISKFLLLIEHAHQ